MTEQDLKDEYEQAVKRRGKLYADGYVEGLKDAQNQALTLTDVSPLTVTFTVPPHKSTADTTAEDMIERLGLEKKPKLFLHLVSGMSKFRRYLTGGMIGMCFEYVYRVDSEVWYLPLGIGVLMSISMIVDVLTDYR
tara:strand:+ start:1971 stop:2378 length:408 start_codon:yes stop_codon:yes gene_type:complete